MVAAISAVIIFFAHFRAFTERYVTNDDVRQQIFWMQQWRDPELYRSDLLCDYARHYVPWGVQSLYWLAAHVMNPIFFSKVLTAFLFVFLSCCFHSAGKTLGGRRLGWIAAGSSWLLPIFLDNFSGGLSRSFAAPLLALFLACALERSARGVLGSLFLQALFIPYIFIPCALAVCLWWASWKAHRAQPPPFPSKWPHFALLAAMGVLVLLMYHSLNKAGYGPLVSYNEMAGRPEFGREGRFTFLPVPSLLWEVAAVPIGYTGLFREWGVPWGTVSFLLIACALAAGGWAREWKPLRGHLPPFLHLALASAILYFLARLVLLKLFIPGRYVSYTAAVFYCLLIALCLQGLAQKWNPGRGALAVAIAAAAVLGAVRLHDVGLFDYSSDKNLCEAILRNTPKNAVIAGHPYHMDNVITFGRRRVFVSYKLAHPWCRGYWERLRPRFEDFFRAYYAADPREVLKFAAERHIDFIVVDDRNFDPDFIRGDSLSQRGVEEMEEQMGDGERRPFFAPFNQEIREYVGERRSFALLQPGIFKEIPVDAHVRILDLRPAPGKAGAG